MGLKSLITSLSLSLFLASSIEAQEFGQELQSRDSYSASRSHKEQRRGKQIRPSGHRSQRYGGYGRSHSQAQRIWNPGHYELVSERYWVAESYERVWIEPVYGWSFGSHGLRIRVCTRAGYWERVCRPGHYATRQVQRWVPGHWDLC